MHTAHSRPTLLSGIAEWVVSDPAARGVQA